jgi:hypothetical protein
VLFTVASDAMAEAIVRGRCKLRDVDRRRCRLRRPQ